jgi:vacuolar-type H+-ATPase subunit I/STV1
MATHPQFLVLLVAMILGVSTLGSERVKAWRILALFTVGGFALWATSGAYSFLGPVPAVDGAGQTIRDLAGHPLYTSEGVSSAQGFMAASLYLGFACIISAVLLGVFKLWSGGISLRNLAERDSSDYERLEPK